MFWDDIKDIKEQLRRVDEKIDLLDEEVFVINSTSRDVIDAIHDKITELLKDDRILQKCMLAQQTADKFEDYMKNIDKLNQLVNEFKGCVAMSRASIQEKKLKTRKPRKKTLDS